MAEKKVKITFTRTVKTDEFDFKQGETYSLVETSATHWIRRGMARLAGSTSEQATSQATETATKPTGEGHAAQPKE